MKKKLLVSQNASLFAELERKGKEIQTLEIKLEDADNKFNSLQAEYDEYKLMHTKTLTEVKELELLVDELRETISYLREKEELATSPMPVITMDTPLTKAQREFLESPPKAEKISKTIPVITMDTPLSEAEKEFLGVNDNEGIAKEYANANSRDDLVTEKFNHPIPEAKPEEISYEELRALGLKAIGEVTKAAATAMADAGDGKTATTAKSMILGKNESFKYEVLSLLENKHPTVSEKDKLISLSENAKAYIKNVNMI